MRAPLAPLSRVAGMPQPQASQRAVINAMVVVTAPGGQLTFDEVHAAWVEWLSLLQLRGWDYTGTSADITVVPD
jgi:hypothetical protein